MTETFVRFPPPKLRRRSRRTTWRCRILHDQEERFCRAAAIHIAGHAVALHDLGIPLLALHVDAARGRGTLDASWLSHGYAIGDRSEAAQNALDRDCVALHAGIVARAFALGWEHTTYGWNDQELVCDLLNRLEYDECLRTSWHEYQRERARCFVAEPWTWTRIEHLAARFAEEPIMGAARVAAYLADVPRERPIVPSRIEWRVPPPTEASNVVLVWQKPTLTQVLARAAARAQSGDGGEE